jgi:hypothetical protein
MPLDPQFLSNLQTEEELNKVLTFVSEPTNNDTIPTTPIVQLEATFESLAPEVRIFPTAQLDGEVGKLPVLLAPVVDGEVPIYCTEISAIESQVHVSAAEGVVTVNDHTPPRATFLEEIGRSSWENNFLSDMERFGNVQVPLHIFLDGLRLREQRAVMWSLQDNDDHSDVRNFVPGYLKKVATNVFEVVDDKNDICFATATVDDPEDGLINLWGTVLKLPTEEFVEHCKENCLFFDGNAARLDGLDHDVTPGRRATREKAALMMNKSARKVLKRMKSRTATLSIGDVVQVPLVQQDRAKVDAQNLTGVVVRVNDTYGMCQVAVKTGVLRPWYVYHKLRAIPGEGNNKVLMGLEEAFINWKSLPVIAPRTASVDASIVGGQGIFQCKCKGKCNTNSCACYKNGRICTSACHRNSKCCENHDQNEVMKRKNDGNEVAGMTMRNKKNKK